MAKIIIVNRFFHPDLSATSQMASGIAFSLAAGGIPVSIVTSRLNYEDPDVRLPPRQTVDGVTIHRVWTSRFGRINLLGRLIDYATFYLSALFRLLLLTRPDDVIIAKTDPPLISIIAWIVCRLKRGRLINWLQDIFPEVAVSLGMLSWNPVVKLARWLRNRSLHAAQVNIAIGENMRQWLLREGIDNDAIHVIHNWSDADNIIPVEHDENELRSKWQLQDSFVVGYSGNMGRAHDFGTIVEAMQQLSEEPGIMFLFIGGGAGKKILEAEFRERGINNYQFRPYQEQDELSLSLSIADIHLVSLQPQLEGLIVPSKIYGIMAAARPYIFVGATDGEIAHLACDTESGICIASGEGAAMATRIRELRDNPEQLASLGANGRTALLRHYSRSCAVELWRHVLLPLMDN